MTLGSSLIKDSASLHVTSLVGEALGRLIPYGQRLGLSMPARASLDDVCLDGRQFLSPYCKVEKKGCSFKLGPSEEQKLTFFWGDPILVPQKKVPTYSGVAGDRDFVLLPPLLPFGLSSEVHHRVL